MEEDKLIESKKILTDYMLELNDDIQRAEDWVNTGADEEMYFAIKTVIDELERLQKENAQDFEKTVHTCLHCGNDTPLYCEKCQQELITKNAELQVEIEELKQDNSKQWKERCKLSFEVDDSIPKQVIRDKKEEVNKEYKKYTEKWEKSGMNKEHPFYRYIVRLEAQIDILEELYGKLRGE